MIVAAGLTPAWQHILEFDGFRVGEVNRVRRSTWTASGKVINVGIALHRLGARSAVVAPLGGVAFGAIERELAASGLTTRWIATGSPTRICTTILDTRNVGGNRTTTMTELVETTSPLLEDDYVQYLAAWGEVALAADVVVVTGSLPADAPLDIYERMLASPGALAIVDARGPELLRALERRPFLVKPNRDELELTLGRALPGDDGLFAGMRELQERGARSVLVTQGADPIWLATEDGRLIRFLPPRVDEPVNPVGCGDCLAAGLAWGLDRGASLIESVRLGVGAAVQNLGEVLPSLVDAETVDCIARTVACDEVA